MVTPGPKYKLPALIGVDHIDPTIKKEPAYSFGVKPSSKPTSVTPGPKYVLGTATRNGVVTSKGAIVSGWNSQVIPGPSRYAPERFPDPSRKKPPEWVFGSARPERSRYHITPGPKYKALSLTCNPLIEGLKKSAPAWSVLGRNKFGGMAINKNSPGPKYPTVRIESYKKKFPMTCILGRSKYQNFASRTIPGPKYFGNQNLILKQPPSFSFGVKHSTKQRMVRLPVDNNDYYGF